MSLGHEKLIVYQMALDYAAWTYRTSSKLTGDKRHLKDQWLRASQSIPLNIAEGNGKYTPADRRKFFEIARGSAMECAAIQDILKLLEILDQNRSDRRKSDLDKISIMLSKLGGRGFDDNLV